MLLAPERLPTMIYLRNIVSLCLSKHPRITHSELLDNLLRSVELGDCLAVFIVDR